MGAALAGIKSSLLLLLPVLAVLSFACGGDDETSGEPAASFPAGGGGDGNEEVQQFDILMSDNSFEPVELTMSGGAVAEFSITNSGAAIHNMRIAGEDNVFNNEDDALSDPSLVNGGETAVLQWPTPVAGGTFDFRCDFHPEAMVGTIEVAESEDSGNGGQEGP